MIYAVMSDIHGNYPAMKAVIKDAKENGANAFILLGDYIRDTPFLNEVVDTIRSLPNCTAILGNGDIGVISLDDTKPEQCEFEQMLPNFWTYKNLTPENLAFLKSLPQTTEITTLSGKILHLSHSIPLIAHSPRLGAFHSGDYALRMESEPFSLEEGMKIAQDTVDEYASEVATFPGDICLYGHNHLQFLGTAAGKTLLNPGSCGMPADYDARAPYALIYDNSNSLEIELKRVKYDMNETINAVRSFDSFPHAKFWGKLHVSLLQSSSDITMKLFWTHARSFNDGQFPMSNDVWRKVIDTFVFPESITKRERER